MTDKWIGKVLKENRITIPKELVKIIGFNVGEFVIIEHETFGKSFKVIKAKVVERDEN